MPPFEFDPNAQPLERMQKMEEAINQLAGGATAGDDNDALDKRLTNIEGALQLMSAAVKDLSQRQADLYSRVTKDEAAAKATAAPKPTA
jgi:hypothetical protein